MGKTAIIQELSKNGHTCIPETGREIIIAQMKIDGMALPWRDRQAFAELMFRQSVQDFNSIEEDAGPVFFDRGIPDTLGYLQLCGLQVPNEMTNAAKKLRYSDIVFLTPPWKEIYQNDKERKQSFEEAVETYKVMKKIYGSLGYHLTELPRLAVAERAGFIISHLKIPF